MKNIEVYAGIAAIGIITAILFSYEIKVRGLEKRIDVLESKVTMKTKAVAVERANNSTLRATIEDMNQKALELAAQYEDAMYRYEEAIAQPPEVKYEKLYIYLDEEKDSNECEDIKNSIDGLVKYINNRM